MLMPLVVTWGPGKTGRQPISHHQKPGAQDFGQVYLSAFTQQVCPQLWRGAME